MSLTEMVPAAPVAPLINPRKNAPLTFDKFAIRGTAERPIFVAGIDNLTPHLPFDREWGWRQRLDVCRHQFEGIDVYAFTREKLLEFLPRINRVVTSRYGSSHRHIDWITIGPRGRLPEQLKSRIHIPDFPEYQIEDARRNHGLDATYSAIASAILSPIVQRKIIFTQTNDFNDRGGFQINMTPAVTNQGNSRWVKPFGFGRNSDIFYVVPPKDQEGLPIGDGDLVVAELYENGLDFLVDISRGSMIALRIFTRVLDDVIGMRVDPEEFKRLRAEAARKVREVQKKSIIDCADRALKRFHGNPDLRREGRRMEIAKQIEDAKRLILHLNQELFAIDTNSPMDVKERISREFDRLMDGSVKKVDRVYFTRPGELNVITHELVAHDRQSRQYRLVDKVRICINLPEGMPNPSRDPYQVRLYSLKGYKLPYTDPSSGSTCWGNIRSEMDRLLANFEIEAVIGLAIAFLERPNASLVGFTYPVVAKPPELIEARAAAE